MIDRAKFRYQGFAWLAMTVALALHVVDEAITGFLPAYNEIARTLRETYWFIPLPVFSYPVWLGGLIAGIAVMFLLAPLVFAGRRSMRYLSYFLSVVMTLNALGHIAASLYLGRIAPGAVSSTVLMAAAIALFVSTKKASQAA